jgi:phage recombination protein Bet
MLYYEAFNLDVDPLKKYIHTVSMPFKKEDGTWDRHITLMPSIDLYRTFANRSGLYAGISEPEYGEEITETIGKKSITYPKWCKITVRKKFDDGIAEFTAKEYWKENYIKEKDFSPNSIWEKRPYSQLAKCTETQVLRKAFPDSKYIEDHIALDMKPPVCDNTLS